MPKWAGRAAAVGTAVLFGLWVNAQARARDADGRHSPVSVPVQPVDQIQQAAMRQPEHGGGLHVAGIVLAAVVLAGVIVAWVLVVRRLRRDR